jgi:hypothetical protein
MKKQVLNSIFIVGDKVKLTEKALHYGNYWVGSGGLIFTVFMVNNDALNYPVTVECNGVRKAGKDEEFILVERNMEQFEVGL